MRGVWRKIVCLVAVGLLSACSSIECQIDNIVSVQYEIRDNKGEAWAMLNEYDRESSRLGLVVKASYIVAPIAHKAYGKKRRKRQRGAGHNREKH